MRALSPGLVLAGPLLGLAFASPAAALEGGEFSLTIQEGLEDDSGYVRMRDGQVFRICLGSRFHLRTDVELRLDGLPLGSFRLNPGQSWCLERLEAVEGRFTFYGSGSAGGIAAGSEAAAPQDRGVVQARFTPELPPLPARDALLEATQKAEAEERQRRLEEEEAQRRTQEAQQMRERLHQTRKQRLEAMREWEALLRGRLLQTEADLRRLEAEVQLEEVRRNLEEASLEERKAAQRLEDLSPDPGAQRRRRPPAVLAQDSELMLRELRERARAEERRRDAATAAPLAPSSVVVPVVPSSAAGAPRSSLSGGVTGLTGRSDQRFRKVPPIETEPARAVTLELRLIHDPNLKPPRRLPGRLHIEAPPPL
ncbi:hypothetical protein [Neomegalonema sp.]|uniref:hypothetical protein n=1 Tax=Neomegalonema sp. TaxID=2039713 RepID=UPI00260774C9|nr:hypothetical protein [Neomegalonema sp.]MDD2866963.1 hypothetical protein [Neomegalonema sp.]